jgi:hypothetical protein
MGFKCERGTGQKGRLGLVVGLNVELLIVVDVDIIGLSVMS